MKRLLSISLSFLVLLIVLGLTTPAFAAPIQHWENKKSRIGTYVDAYNSNSLANYGAVWIPTRAKWEWTFRVDGTGALKPHTGYDTHLYYATIDINEVNDTLNNLSIWSSASPEYIGTIPESAGSGGDADYSAAIDVVGYGVQALDLVLPGIGWVWTPWQIILGMESGSDTQINTATRVMRRWLYPYTWNANQYFWFLCDVKPSKTVYFKHEYDIEFQDVYANTHLHLGPYTFSLTAPGPGSAAAGWSPSMLSGAETSSLGIEAIPIDQISARAAGLGIPEETVAELLKSGERVVYFAHTPSVKQVSPREAVSANGN